MPYQKQLTQALERVKRASGGRVATGPLKGASGGRADSVKRDVHDGSHVIPADVVSALGDGNTAAGFKVLSHMFPSTVARSAGGKAPVKCALSDGEFVITPEQVAAHGGHDAIDKWMMKVRAHDIERRKNLPGPAK